MTNVYRFSLLFIFLSIASSAALAALPSWQGPYLGVYSGGSFGNEHTSTDVGTVTNSSYFTNSANVNAVNNAGAEEHHVQSTIIGIQAGHDWAWNQIVYGIAFDYSALPLVSSSTADNLIYPDNSGRYSVDASMSTHWLFTLRGRVGFATTTWWPTLFYLTGGPALTQLKVSNSFNDNVSGAAGGNQTVENKKGWVAGAGLDLMPFNHLSLYFEYLYLQVPSVKNTSSITNTQGGFGIPTQSMTSPFTTIGKFHANVIKIGLNYKFDE